MDGIELEFNILQAEPVVFIVGGVHGAGKSSFCAKLLSFKQLPLVTPEEVRKTLTEDYSQQEIYRRIHQQVDEYLGLGKSFIFEHVMSGHYVEKLISKANAYDLNVHLVYIDIKSSELAYSRVAERVSQGGHHRDQETIKRRLGESRTNFYNNYKNMANSWSLYCNSEEQHRCIATRGHSSEIKVYLELEFKTFIALCTGKK